MARTTQNPSTQVNLRMPDSILDGIDKLAGENLHDRSAEINSACRYWIELGGKEVTGKTTLEKISSLEMKVDVLEEEVRKTLAEMKSERELLLKIIENHEHTIKKLLNTLPSSDSRV